MILPETKAEIRRLVLADGWKIETVARRFGVHHSVVRRATRTEPASERAPTPAPSALEPFKPYVVQRLSELPELTAVRLLLELRDRGFQGGIAQVRRYVAKVRTPRARKAYLRVEVEPCEQAQVDWGSFGVIRVAETQRPLSCFAMVLSYSRALYLDFALDQRMDTFLRMHEVKRLTRLLERYGPDDFTQGVRKALANQAFGARFVRNYIDQHRFAQGLPEAPEPITTGNRAADELDVEPHDLGGYDELF